MRRLFLVLIVACIAGMSLSAWEPNDLTKFPPGMDAKSWILNLGMGFPDFSKYRSDYVYIPPLRLSLDRNIEVGDKKLPFFVGGILGYSGYGYIGNYWRKYFYHDISLGGRFGYHFNWGVKNLDTYAVTTAGWIIYAGDNYNRLITTGIPLWGINIGVRYFVSKGFGFWAEAGINSISWLDIGLAFKF